MSIDVLCVDPVELAHPPTSPLGQVRLRRFHHEVVMIGQLVKIATESIIIVRVGHRGKNMKTYYRLALGINTVSIVVALLFAIENINLLILVVAMAGLLGCLIKMEHLAREKFNFYEQILDAIPNPLSVTDMDCGFNRWTQRIG